MLRLGSSSPLTARDLFERALERVERARVLVEPDVGIAEVVEVDRAAPVHRRQHRVVDRGDLELEPFRVVEAGPRRRYAPLRWLSALATSTCVSPWIARASRTAALECGRSLVVTPEVGEHDALRREHREPPFVVAAGAQVARGALDARERLPRCGRAWSRC